MNSQIVQYILSLFNEEATQKIAGQLGEDQHKVKSALAHAIPTIIRGFAAKSAEGTEQVTNLMDLASSANSSSWFQKASDWFTGSDMLGKGEEILNAIFGNKNVDRIATNLAAQSDIKRSSANTLLQWAAPLSLGAVGKFIGDGQMNVAGLASWLSNETQPSNVFSTAANTAIPAASVKSDTYRPSYKEETKSGSKIWIPIVILLLAGLLWWLLKGCNDNKDGGQAVSVNDTTVTTTTTTTTTGATSVKIPTFKLDADSTLTYVYGDTIVETLPDGSIMRIPNNSAEALLIDNIKTALKNGLDTTEEGKKNGWINLYDIQFTRMLEYRKGAAEQIYNIGKILKAYPTIQIKLGGYTDNTGADELNQKLSQQRAELVFKNLVNSGLATQLDKAEGYGSQFPVAEK